MCRTGVKLYVFKKLGYPLGSGREFRGGVGKLYKVVHPIGALLLVLRLVVVQEPRGAEYLVDKVREVLVRLGKEGRKLVVDLKELLQGRLALALDAGNVGFQPGGDITTGGGQDFVYRGLANAPGRLVYDALEGDLVPGVHQKGHPGQGVFYLFPLVEPQRTHYAVRYIEPCEHALEEPGLGIGAV